MHANMETWKQKQKRTWGTGNRVLKDLAPELKEKGKNCKSSHIHENVLWKAFWPRSHSLYTCEMTAGK